MELLEQAILPRSILVIDDDILARSGLKEVFQYVGYTVYEAGNGKEGIDCYRQNPADIVLTDIFMPQKDGLETIRELKHEFPGVKIIAMSGHDSVSVDYLRIAGYLGALHFIKKPFSTDDIINIVNLTFDEKLTMNP